MPIALTFTFQGCCLDAIRLYEKAFGADVKYIMRYRDSKREDTLLVDPQFMDLVYHAEMDICGSRAMLADEITDKAPSGANVLSLTATFDSPAKVRVAFSCLRPGGTVVKAMRMTTFSACVATITDKFGVTWGLMTEAEPDFKMREITPADADSVINIIDSSIESACMESESPDARRAWAKGYRERVIKGVESGSWRGLLMHDDSSPCGVCLYSRGYAKDVAEIEAFYIDKRIWGIGAGRYMMDALIAKLHANKIGRSFLWAPSDDMRARFFFDDCSYSLTGEERETSVSDGENALQYGEVRYELETEEYGI